VCVCVFELGLFCFVFLACQAGVLYELPLLANVNDDVAKPVLSEESKLLERVLPQVFVEKTLTSIVDNSNQSTVRVMGADSVEKLMAVLQQLPASPGDDVPTLLSPVQFVHGALSFCKTQLGESVRSSSAGLTRMQRLELSGFVLPHQLYNLAKRLRVEHADLEIMLVLDRLECWQHAFNLPPKDADRISTGGQGADPLWSALKSQKPEADVITRICATPQTDLWSVK